MGKLNSAIQTPPSFVDREITGVPFSFLFVEYWETPRGQKFFSQEKVNRNLKDVFSVYGNLLNSK